MIVLCHLGVPRIDHSEWTLRVDGLVERPLQLTYGDLARYRSFEVASVHQCAGSPLQPQEPTRRICNVAWTGVRLTEILSDARPMPAARFVWSYGADYGEFAGCAVDFYQKDLPLERVSADALVATAMNGKPLSEEHGFPARLVVPGFYGTNSTKWLTRLSLADRRADSPFTTRWYNDPVFDHSGSEIGKVTPVWSIAPESVIVSPAPDEVLAASSAPEIWGWAWSDSGVRNVGISADGGETWMPAEVEPSQGREWQRFSLRWCPPGPGPYSLVSRAESSDGELQPDAGRRNAIHAVAISVR